MKGDAKNYHLCLLSGKIKLWNAPSVLAPPGWVGRQCSDVLSQHKQGRLLPQVSAQTPLPQACVCGLRWFRPAAWSGWGPWTNMQLASVSQLVVRVQIETKCKSLNRANKYWVWLVEVDNLPLSLSVNFKIWTRAEILCLQRTSYQGGWAPSWFERAVKTSVKCSCVHHHEGSALGELSLVNETPPSAELHLYLMFYSDLVHGDFLQSENSCVVF